MSCLTLDRGAGDTLLNPAMANMSLIDNNRDNCSHDLPFSDEFFRDISDVELAFIIACGVISLCTMASFVEKVRFVLQHYKTMPSVIHKSIQILGIYPVITFTAMLALCVPRASVVCDLVGSVYIAWSLFSFTSLLVDYFGGEHAMLTHLEGKKIPLQSPPLACCFCCLPAIDLNRKNFHRVRLLVFQNALLQPLLAFLSVVLWVDNKYNKGAIRPDNAYPYLALPNGASTLVAMYGLIMVFRVTQDALKPLNIRAKLLVLQLVLVFHNLQGFVFDFLGKFDIPPCKGILSSQVRGQALMHMLVVWEMFILAVAARCFYRRPHDNVYMPNDAAGGDTLETVDNGHISMTKDTTVDKYGAINSSADVPVSSACTVSLSHDNPVYH